MTDAPKPPPVLDAAGDIVVVSDLHIGRGENPETGRYHNLEAFFYDDDFHTFCEHLCEDARERGVPFTLVLNGDVVDLLRIDPEPVTPSARASERRYGAPNTPETAPRAMRQILAGHPMFVRALAEVLDAGHYVVLLSGNHDIETQWEPVRDEVRRAVGERLASGDALERLVFRSWFYYIPGRVWIEHGCQYDPANAFRYLLRGNLPEVEDAVYAAEHDMPLGNFFQRYLYNGFGHITFIVPDARANARYVRWFLVNRPRFLFRVLLSHVPFAGKVLRRIAKSGDPAKQQLEQAHKSAVKRIAQSTGLGDKLQKIDNLKEVQADAVQAVSSIGKELIKTAVIVAVSALAAVSLWFVGFMAITQLGTADKLGLGLRALLFITLNLVMLALAFGLLTRWLLRAPEAWKARPLRKAAQRIVDVLDVPIVAFGHTHSETVSKLHRPHKDGWYFNTGTWIAIFTMDELVPRERVQYTFLRVRGEKGELLHWSPGRGEPLRVILLDDPPVDLI